MVGTQFKSCFFEGVVKHNRLSPKPHQFKYPIMLAYLNLDELQGLSDRKLLTVEKKFSLLSFCRGDFHRPEITCLKKAVHQTVKEKLQLTEDVTGSVFMLGMLRHWGYVFNPVSFYFSFSKDGTLQYIMAEITNTPWSERYQYVFDMVKMTQPFEFKKEFHVSPFMSMDINYKWSFSRPGEAVAVKMENFQQDEKVFEVNFSASKLQWEVKNKRRLNFKYAFMTAKVTFWIYIQALRLYLKKNPFFEHPKFKDENSLEKSA